MLIGIYEHMDVDLNFQIGLFIMVLLSSSTFYFI